MFVVAVQTRPSVLISIIVLALHATNKLSTVMRVWVVDPYTSLPVVHVIPSELTSVVWTLYPSIQKTDPFHAICCQLATIGSVRSTHVIPSVLVAYTFVL
jgi:hypothetical protein